MPRAIWRGSISFGLVNVPVVAYDEIDPIYFEWTFHLGPQDDGASTHVCTLLVKAIEDVELAGICSYIFHNREQLGCLRVRDGVLVLERMYFANEIRDPKTARPGKRPKLKQGELKMARELIDSMTTGFKPGNYEDSYGASLLKVIRRKCKGKTITPPEPEEREELPDLMSPLQVSLKSSGRRKPARPKARRTPKGKPKTRAKT